VVLFTDFAVPADFDAGFPLARRVTAFFAGTLRAAVLRPDFFAAVFLVAVVLAEALFTVFFTVFLAAAFFAAAFLTGVFLVAAFFAADFRAPGLEAGAPAFFAVPFRTVVRVEDFFAVFTLAALLAAFAGVFFAARFVAMTPPSSDRGDV